MSLGHLRHVLQNAQAESNFALRGQHPGEYYMVLVATTLGMFYMASATNMLMAYLALEFVSQASYILSGFLKHNRRSGEPTARRHRVGI